MPSIAIASHWYGPVAKARQTGRGGMNRVPTLAGPCSFGVPLIVPSVDAAVYRVHYE